jgi:SAM-dependent methyltransferase
MLFKLLRQIPLALARYIAYRVQRLFKNEVGQPSDPATSPGPHAQVDLDASYLALTDWPVYQGQEDPEVLVEPIYQLWRSIPNGHKWSQYFQIYRKVFESRRGKPLRILEIGVYRGASLALWRKYFSHPDSFVLGIDIDPSCVQYAVPSEHIEVRIGSQSDENFLMGLVAEFGPFDIIIDDGSHRTAHQIQSFSYLFDRGLKAGGVYLVEDLHANYWPAWRDSAKTFLDVCKDLIELMHIQYHLNDKTGTDHSLGTQAALRVPAITRMLGEIRIFDSIAVIEKVERSYASYWVTIEQANDPTPAFS